MSCKEFSKDISLHVDGRLDPAGERHLQEHLTVCPRCREALALLESAEKTARTAGTHAPREGYWDTFSGRVMRRIETEEARREEAWWKRWMPVTLPPPGKRKRFAAGVASIAVAVVVGALFVSRQGDRAVLTAGQIERSRELPAEVETPEEKGEDMLAEGETTTREEDAARAEKPEEKPVLKPEEKLAEKKVTPPPMARTQAAPATEKAEAASAAGKKDATPPAATPQEAPEPAPTQVAEAVKEDTPQDKRPAAAENEALDVAASTEASNEGTLSSLAPEKKAQPKPISFTAAEKRGQGAVLHGSRPVGGVTLRNIADSDTTLTVEGLRAHITGWKGLIASSPADSVTNDGYREVANAYCLLAKQTRAESDIEEGARVIQTYLDRSKDSEVKTYLAARLEEIQGLRNK